jgi:hypothetical protein
MKKITIIKGKIDSIKISNTTFPLYDISTTNGVTTAIVDASAVLGDSFKRVAIIIDDYKN